MQPETGETRPPGHGINVVPTGATVFLTYKEFAYESRLSPSTVRKRVRAGQLRGI